ncbi:MAG: STAS/SEC14 domain-containing protein [Polyangiaceae bacterium]|nr:STAS/SEC14 domain-containing protein [Polyangiaceae bacterium]
MVKKTTRFGCHELWFEDPDLVCFRVVGDVSARELEETFRMLLAHGEGRGPQLWLFEMAEAGAMNAEARRCAAEWTPRLWIGAVAMIHAGFEQRIVTTMLAHVYRLVGVLSYPVRSFDDEAAARAWLASVRG